MEKIAIIASSRDLAGVNIRNSLIGLFDFEKLDENIDNRIDADIFVFASKHRSKENTKSFAVHPIGNWGKAELGGQDGKLCNSSAVLMKNLFVALNENAKDTGYQITM